MKSVIDGCWILQTMEKLIVAVTKCDNHNLTLFKLLNISTWKDNSTKSGTVWAGFLVSLKLSLFTIKYLLLLLVVFQQDTNYKIFLTSVTRLVLKGSFVIFGHCYRNKGDRLIRMTPIKPRIPGSFVIQICREKIHSWKNA